MTGTERRREIREHLLASASPVKGAMLASLFSVSRQVIVQDMAVLRAEGVNIVATPQGYLLLSGGTGADLRKTVVTRHTDDASMEEELTIMVDRGARVLNVIVEHPLYGEIAGNLMISTRDDVARFMEKMRARDGEPLSMLTGGVHLHTLELPDETTWISVLDGLREKNYLIEEK